MVLPPSAPHDAPRPAEASWLDSIRVALTLNRAGLLILVDHARPEHLGELVRALLPEHPELEVYTDVRCALTVPEGSTLVLAPTAEDAEWLNLNRPLFALRQLRVILFCETEVAVALARQAVDFFDWISHRVECPGGPPRYAVAGLRCALAARAPGIVWTGGELDASFAAARPRRKLRRVSAALPYPELLQQVREAGSDWIAWTDVDGEFRLRRVRWALIEAGRRGRAILVEPGARSPGWWPVHARVAGIREAREKLELSGARVPGRLAALVDFEPEAVECLGSMLSKGEPALEAQLVEGTDPDARLAELWRQQVLPGLNRSADGEVPPFALRGLGLRPKTARPLREIRLEEFREKLRRGEQIDQEEVEALFRRVLTFDGEELKAHPQEYAAFVRMLAITLDRQGRYSEAAALARRSLALQGEVLGSRHAGYEASLRALARALLEQGQYKESERLLRQALAIAEEVAGASSREFATSLQMLAVVLERQGRYDEAENLLRRALVIQEGELGASHMQYGVSLRALAVVLQGQGKYGEAERLLRQVLVIGEKALGASHPDYGRLLHALAIVLEEQGKYIEAEELLRQALIIEKRALEPGHPQYGMSLSALAAVLVEQGKYVEAEGLLRQALVIEEKALGSGHPSYGIVLHTLASALARQGKYTEAEELLRQALAISTQSTGPNHLTHGASLHELAGVLEKQGKYDEAEGYLRQALANDEQTLGASHPSLIPTLSYLAGVLSAQGRAAEGEPFSQRALNLARSIHGVHHPDTAQVLNVLAQLQAMLGREEAPETAREALEALEVTLGAEHPYTRSVTPILQAISNRPRGSD